MQKLKKSWSNASNYSNLHKQASTPALFFKFPSIVALPGTNLSWGGQQCRHTPLLPLLSLAGRGAGGDPKLLLPHSRHGLQLCNMPGLAGNSSSRKKVSFSWACSLLPCPHVCHWARADSWQLQLPPTDRDTGKGLKSLLPHSQLQGMPGSPKDRGSTMKAPSFQTLLPAGEDEGPTWWEGGQAGNKS